MSRERAAAGKRHMESIKGAYQGVVDQELPDALQFEFARFRAADRAHRTSLHARVASDRDLFMDAWNRNVLLVSPSTLLFVVRTVAHLWRQEAQSRNAQEIAKRSAELYDKFVGFVEDMIPSATV
jgi:DNA recombination protein RmuC